jgi:ribosomal protein S18 acetylase RimI-like enzyme
MSLSKRLFTFEANKNAQRFYERHGFKVVARGFEKEWQLADIEYEWSMAEAAR